MPTIKNRKVKKNTETVTKSQLRKALKEHDVASREIKMTGGASNGTLATAGALVEITRTIVQGDGLDQRNGNQINLKTIEFCIQYLISASANVDWTRIVVFRDLFNNGAAPAVTDVLNSAVTTSQYTRRVLVDHRFKILFDKVQPLSVSGSNRATSTNFKCKFNEAKVNYFSTGNTVADNGPGSVWAIVMCDAATNQSTYALRWLSRFYDG